MPRPPRHAERLRLPRPESFPVGNTGICSVLIFMGWNRDSESEEIVLTKRTQHVETHKGQVSFPGGFWEPTDETLLVTALRETEEEIGVKRGDLRLIGPLPLVKTRGSIPIYPWVATGELPYPFQVSEQEVEKLLFLPVSRLLDEGLKPVQLSIEDHLVESIGIEVSSELVWGATARMLALLRDELMRP